jgi:hypothetical protein
MKSDQTVRELLARVRSCLEEAGLDMNEESGEHEALVAGRVEIAEGAPLSVVVHISDEERPAIKFGSVVARSVAAAPAEAVQRPTLEGRSAAGTAESSEPGRTPGSGQIASELEKLGELRETGVLTTEEFKSAKKRLLDRI